MSDRTLSRTSRTALALGLATALASAFGQGSLPPAAGSRPAYPWKHGISGGTVESRFAPPPGFSRIPSTSGSFAAWLRGLPVKPGCPNVHLYDGRPKSNPGAHCAVLDVDVGDADLQQCADAIIRIRAEYLYSRDCDAAIRFAFTSGDLAEWTDWRSGMRPEVRGNRVSWRRTADPDGGYTSFRRYLESVFTYAGTASLAGETEKVPDASKPEVGDLYIRGGSPGHAVLVLDATANSRGERVVLLAQSYMPAQDLQVLRNPGDPASPWYRALRSGPLETPEWRFDHGDLRRFPPTRCP